MQQADNDETAEQRRTFLFTDIENSTELWDRHPAAMRAGLAHHDRLLREAADAHHGHVFKTVGDAFYVAFAMPADALGAAIAAQRALHQTDWGELGALRVRMAVHGGTVEARDNDYFGPPLNEVARLRDAGHGGQILVSETLCDALGPLPPPGRNDLAGLALIDKGPHKLKGIAEAQRIYQAQAPDLPATFAALRTLSENNNLPAATSLLVGRENEARTLCALMENPAVRLVTLTGLGGSGKTRLALDVAEELLPGYPDGVWFADLAPLSDPDLVLPTLARACGLAEDPARTALQQLGERFRSGRALIVLDNFEQVEDAADDVAGLLRACARLQVLVTSRTLLNLSMEHEYPVPPLGAPACLSLFAARVRQVQPDFVITGTNRHDVESLCAQLDGIPLAVELAAAQTRSLTPGEIGQALDRRLQVLSTRMRDLPPRHRSLRGAIDGSYDLLSETERRLFRALSVFVGGFSVEAVEAVCGTICRRTEATFGGRGGGALALLSDLRDKSLVRAEREGQKRFVLLESLRQYGAERLQEDEPHTLAALREQHAAYYGQLARREEPRLNGADQIAALAVLESEVANLRAALAFLRETGAWEDAARSGVALRRFWQLRSHVCEGRDFLTQVAAHGEAVADQKLRARLLFAAGALCRTSGDPNGAAPFYEQSLRLCEAFGDLIGAAQALNGLGGAAYNRGDLGQAEAYYARAQEAEQTRGNDRGVAMVLNNRGLVALARGEYEQAETLYRDSLAVREQLGDQASQAQIWNHLGMAALARGRVAEARDAFARSCDLSERVGDAAGRAYARINQGHLVLREGDLAEAERLYQDALQTLRPIEDRFGVAECVTSLGLVAARRGEHAVAAHLCREGLSVHQKNHDKKGIASALEALAEVAAGQNKAPDARVFLVVAERLRGETGARRTPDEAAHVAALEQRVGTGDADLSDPPPTLDEAVQRASALAAAQDQEHDQ